MNLTIILFCILAYLVGSIPVGKIVAASRGVDIQNTGTGNIGASNTYLVLGKKAAIIVLFCDLGKAYFMMEWALYTFSIGNALFVSLFLLLGNIKSVFLRFTGGKGIATGLGIFLATEPIAAFVMVAFWGIALIYMRYLMYFGIIGALLISYNYYRYEYDFFAFIYSLLLCVMILVRHRSYVFVKEKEEKTVG